MRETLPTTAVRILVADDNPVNREVALRLLEKQGCVADGAVDGEDAVRMHGAAPYALILMDCDMPVVDGYEATRRIRAMEGQQRHAPVIALTAGSSAEEAQRCLEAGMDGFLSKPLRPQALAEVLERWVSPIAAGAATENHASGDEVDAVRRIFGKDYAELAALYQSDTPLRLAALRRALADGDSIELARVAHALGGSSMSIGATGLSAMCSTLEKRVKLGALGDAADRLAAIETEYARITLKLQQLPKHS